jgi:acyl-CoA thioesterase FadM
MEEAARAGYYSADGIFRWRQAVRAYEPGADGRLSVGTLLRYCEWVANGASAAAGFGSLWYAERNEGWVVFRQTIEVGAPVGLAQDLDCLTWVRSYTRVSAQRNYQLRRARDGAIAACVETTWAYVDRERQTPKRIPEEIPSRTPMNPAPALPSRIAWGQPPASPAIATARWQARGYEADSLKHVNNCIYGDWVAEAGRLALLAWRSADDPHLSFVARQPMLLRRLSLHYQRSARPGDEIAITSAAERVGSRGVVLAHTIALAEDPGAIVLSATTTYVACQSVTSGLTPQPPLRQR